MKEKFSPEDWEELKLLPFIVFNFVAAADGKIDQKEAAQYVEELKKAPMLRDALHRELLIDIVQSNLADILAKSMDLRKMQERLTRAKEILKQVLSHEEYNRFVGSMIISGKNIAEASGGFMGFGDKVSDDEKKALVALTVLLDVDLSVVAKSFGQ